MPVFKTGVLVVQTSTTRPLGVEGRSARFGLDHVRPSAMLAGLSSFAFTATVAML